MGLPWRVLLVCAIVARSSCHVDHSEDSDRHDHRTMYLNEWGVEIHGGEENARAVAEATGFIYVSPVGSLDNFHTFAHPNHPERHHEHAADKTATLHGHGEVRWTEQQKILRRSKRSVQPRRPERQTGQQRNVPLSATAGRHGEPYPSPQDPSWPSMWYHHRRYQDPRPVWHRGFTGRGIVVSILDDGIDYTHPDLKLPYDAQASYDFNDKDADPIPRPTSNDENRHGTRCAGEVSATMNDECVVGAAYNSSIGGVRMLDGSVTDTVEGNSLSFNPQHIDIYSSSWGPDDDGLTVDGPAKQAQAAFRNGAEQGRGGLGSIFVWASGNGGTKGDSCGCDGYTNTIYSISVSAMSQSGDSPWYSEHCASTMATTYSSGSGGEQQIVTVDLHRACTAKHTGTSAAAPMAAGLLALALEANPKLTWRDTQHIVVLTSQPHPPDVIRYNPAFWSRSGAGHLFSHEFGFGLMHPAAMANLAQHWTSVPEMKTCLEHPFNIDGTRPGTFTFDATACAGTANEVRYAENVVAIITVGSPLRGGLKFDLTSPMGTTSNLLPRRRQDRSPQGFDGWRFLTVFNWGENPKGKWKFSVESSATVQVRSIQLEIHGTTQPPAIRKLPEMGACHAQCYDGCIGLSSADCHSCKELTVFKRDGSFDCVGGSVCPPGFVRAKKTCRPCASTACWRCSADRHTCEACSAGMRLLDGKCSKDSACPPGMARSSQNDSCQPCAPGCARCVNATSCGACASGMLWRGKCVQTCPPTVSFQMGAHCLACHAPCVGCGPLASICLACERPLVRLENGTCADGCGEAAVGVGGVCQPCPGGCEACSSALQCTRCRSSLLQTADKRCVSTCPGGHRADFMLGRCVPCRAQCAACAEKLDVCSSCKTGLVLTANGQCASACPSSEYLDGNGRNCHRCLVTNCHRCAETGTDCDECQSGRLLLRRNGKVECVAACPVKYFADGQARVCSTCNDGCLSCTHSPANCASCPPGKLLHGNACVSRCPPGTYRHGDQCLPCDPACAACSGGGVLNCTRCVAAGNVLDAETGCTARCRPGFFSNTTHCVGCRAPCGECNADAATCTACASGRFLSSRLCLEHCPAGFAADKSSMCQPCKENCDSCPPGHVLLDHRCVTGCPALGFALEAGQCRKCADGAACRVCSRSAERCEECQLPRRFLHGERCVSRCPPGQFAHGRNICDTCHASCAECVSAEAMQCTACQAGQVLQSGSCVVACRTGYYPHSAAGRPSPTCMPCGNRCAACRNGTSCVTCKTGFARSSDGACVSSCGLGKVLDVGSQQCLDCPLNCQQCKTSAVCDLCQPPTLLLSGACLSRCPGGHFPSAGRCRKCPGGCATCASLDACSACMPGLHRHDDGQCLATCPVGMYAAVGGDAAGVAGQCLKCHAMCKTCSGPRRHHCMQCVAAPPDGWYQRQSGGGCGRCHTGCKTCVGSPTTCSSCHPGNRLSDGKTCSPSCAALRQFYDPQLNECRPCPPRCASCRDNATACTSCAADHRLSAADGRCYPCCGVGVVNTNAPCCACRAAAHWCTPPFPTGGGGVVHSVEHRQPDTPEEGDGSSGKTAGGKSVTRGLRIASVAVAGGFLVIMVIYLVLLVRRKLMASQGGGHYSKLAREDGDDGEMDDAGL